MVLPAALSASIAWETLEALPGSFVDTELKDRHADLLFGVTLSGREARIHVLYEHQSAPHGLMAFRLVAYSVRIWEAWLKVHPDARTLPAIVPVVLHHGMRGWTAARALEELYDLDDETREAAGEHLLRMRFALDDLGAQSDEALRARAMSALGRLSLYCFRHAREPEALVRELGAWVELMLEVRAAPNGGAALGSILRYIVMVHPEPPEVVLPQLERALGDSRLKETLMTCGEILMQRGEARGEARGELQATRRLLKRQLGLRFGPLPESVDARIEAADVPTLETWADRVLTAASVDDVLGGPGARGQSLEGDPHDLR